MAQREEPEYVGTDIDWITETSVETPRVDSPGLSTASIAKRTGRWPAVLLGLAVVAVVYLVLGATEPADESVDPPRPIAPAIAVVEADRTDRTPGTSAFERFPPFGFPEMQMVITDRGGEKPVNVSTVGSILALDDTSLIGLSDFSMDAGGEYWAALSRPEIVAPDSGSVLWVGPVNGELEPLVTGVQGFAWHDTEAGRLAFIAVVPGQGGSRLFTIDLTDDRPSLEEVPDIAADLAGRLVLWGEWGFVVEGGGSPWIVIDPAGRPVIDVGVGLVIGYLPSHGLVSVPLDSPREAIATDITTMDPSGDRENAEPLVRPVDALGGLLPFPNLAVGGIEGMVALQAIGEDLNETVVIVLDAAGSEVVRFSAGDEPVPVVWIDDGRQLAFIDEDRVDGTSLVLYDAVDGELRTLLLGFLDPFEHRVQALTLG